MKHKLITALASLLLPAFSLAQAIPGIVLIRELEKGQRILVNHQERTLYTFDVDKDGASDCYDGCAQAWPALLVTSEQAQLLVGDFSVVKRKDNSLQVRFQNSPLYLFVGDSVPGDLNGDGLQGVWHIVQDKE